MPGSQPLMPVPRLSAEEIRKKADLVVYEPDYVLPDDPRDISRLDRERIMARVEIIRRSNASSRRIDEAGKHSKRKSRGRSKRKSRGTRR